MPNYVCIFFSPRSEIESVEAFAAADDRHAMDQAKVLSVSRGYDQHGYQLWLGTRKLIDTRPGPKPIPPQYRSQNFAQQG